MNIRRTIGRAVLAGAMFVGVAGLAGLSLASAPVAHAANCTKIVPEFSGMTAALINPPSPVTGTVNAGGCDVGVYFGPGYHGEVSHADISGATAFGIVVDSATVTIKYSNVHGIPGATGGGCEEGGDDGEMNIAAPGGGEQREYTGCKHGTGILVTGLHGHASIYGSSVSTYGRRGVSVSGPDAWASITGNVIDGSDNGITRGKQGKSGVWIANGAGAVVSGNTIKNNARVNGEEEGGPASNGVMVAGGSYHSGQPNFTVNIKIDGNRLLNNSTGVLLSNLDGNKLDPINPSVKTKNHVSGNYIERGDTGQAGNTAGVFVAGGNGDKITGNTIVNYAESAIKVSLAAEALTLIEGNKIIG